MNHITVVVTGVGGGVGQSVIKGLRLASSRSNRKYRIIGLDVKPLAAGLYRSDKGYLVPKASSMEYVDKIIEICNKERADALIPCSDPEVVEIARHKEIIEGATNTKVIVSSLGAVMIGYDKWETYQFLSKNGFKAPITALPDNLDYLFSKTTFPLVVKPRTGSASRGVSIVMNPNELEWAISQSKNPIIQEYLIPENWPEREYSRAELSRQVDEYSTEVLVSSDGMVLGSITNWREMDKGIPVCAIIEDFDEIRKECEKIVVEMKALGPVNLQARVTRKGIIIFEINTRFSGSTAVRCAAGFNGPDTMIRSIVLNEPIYPEDLKFNKLIEMRYKDEIYISKEDFEKIKQNGCISRVGIKLDYF